VTRAGVDRTGQRFGAIVVTGRLQHEKGKPWLWRYMCDCGKTGTADSSNLKRKTSCPDCSTKRINAKNTSHGLTDTWLFRRWRSMLRRCYDPSCPRFERYGGRGIAVHPRWHDVSLFVLDLPSCPGRQYQLDRIDNNKDYEPGNVKWSLPKDNARNRSNNRLLTYKGRTQCLSAWEEELGINKGKLSSRLRKGWTVERALTTT
jgi:DNA-directed RNA polymerase subunit RPC12/RpoP